MSILEEALALRRELAAMAATPEWSLLVRHDLLAQKQPASYKERVWRRVRSWLAAVRVLPPRVTQYAWLPTLKHAPRTEGARTLLIWAFGVERNALRQMCRRFAERLADEPQWAPVLVTDVADFAYFSRLGWLVEYLPELTGEGISYSERKSRYLAWRYRGSCIVPAAAGLASDIEWQALLKAASK